MDDQENSGAGLVTNEEMLKEPSAPYIQNVTVQGPAPAIKPDQRLTDLADLFHVRNQQYGDSYLGIGPVMAAIFPAGLKLSSADDWNRFFCFFMCIGKLHRYAMKFDTGGQQDSLDDTAVYAQMLAYVDALNKGAQA
jgi:hypothetical protein